MFVRKCHSLSSSHPHRVRYPPSSEYVPEAFPSSRHLRRESWLKVQAVVEWECHQPSYTVNRRNEENIDIPTWALFAILHDLIDHESLPVMIVVWIVDEVVVEVVEAVVEVADGIVDEVVVEVADEVADEVAVEVAEKNA